MNMLAPPHQTQGETLGRRLGGSPKTAALHAELREDTERTTARVERWSSASAIVRFDWRVAVLNLHAWYNQIQTYRTYRRLRDKPWMQGVTCQSGLVGENVVRTCARQAQGEGKPAKAKARATCAERCTKGWTPTSGRRKQGRTASRQMQTPSVW